MSKTSEPRMIRGWIDGADFGFIARTMRPVWSRAVAEESSVPVVIVPASYVDAVEALVAQVEEIASTVAASWIDDALRGALQQYREATGA